MTVAHLHEWTTVHAHYHQVANGEHKAVGAPKIVESLACALAPSVFVVARDDVVWFGESVENRLHIMELLIATFVGQVARNKHIVHIAFVDFRNSGFQFCLISVTWSDVDVAKDSEFLSGKSDTAHKQCQNQCHHS